MNIENDLKNTVNFLHEEYKIPKKECVALAIKMQHNKVLAYSFGLNGEGLTYLEAIAMCLGANDGSKIPITITDSISELASALSDISRTYACTIRP